MSQSRTRELKLRAQEAIEQVRDELVAASHAINADPEEGFQEHQACALLSGLLASHGLDVERAVCDLPTAFVAAAGASGPNVAICAEYDALPSIGHACGHNVIGAASAGAGIGLAAIADRAALRVAVIGTPAEEAGNASGKIVLLAGGAFDGVDAAMMVHPGPFDIAEPVMIAAALFDVQYQGREAHAAYYPELGINAADAVVVAQVSIGLLRQHVNATDRIHGIVTDGGDAPNIIPAHAGARYMVRAERLDGLEALRERVLACFKAGATATGAKLNVLGGDRPYAHVQHDPTLARMYRANAERLGREFPDGDMRTRPAGSTDMGNVSLKVPSIHPFIGIGSWPVVNHQPEFAAHSIGPLADQAVVEGAIALAWTAIDYASQ